jgi:hypothetical protein
MPASEAQILANRRNAAKSTGPKTEEGKARSRGNALKHGLTGAGVVLPNEDAAEVERMFEGLEAQFRPSDDAGRVLARRLATCAVRMERAVLQESAALRERVLEAEAEAEANGDDPDEAGLRAMFDPSKEATLARKYEAAAERGFFRALKELRQLAREDQGTDVRSAASAEAAAARKSIGQLASFFPAVNPAPSPAKAAPSTPAPPSKTPSKPAPAPSKTVFPAWKPAFGGSVDVPISIGLAR